MFTKHSASDLTELYPFRHELYEAQVNAGLVPKYEAVDPENPEHSMAAAEFICGKFSSVDID